MGREEAIERALARAFGSVVGPTTPPRLRAAMEHAVFPGGARVRPELVIAVAEACGNADREAAEAAAVAVELLHCASLVHDDLPCFDNAATRRGRPSVHVVHGEALAVLTGDGLIVAAFQTLARGCGRSLLVLPRLMEVVSSGVGSIRGLVAGQAWESEARADLRRYHRAKTAALFETCVCAGALAGGGTPEAWRPVGTRLGEAYQLADDLSDLVGSPKALGKPIGQDVLLGRPSAALELGFAGACARIDMLTRQLGKSVPDCDGHEAFCRWLAELCARLLPARVEGAHAGSSSLSA